MNLVILEGKFKQNQAAMAPAGKTNLQKCTDCIDTYAISLMLDADKHRAFLFYWLQA